VRRPTACGPYKLAGITRDRARSPSYPRSRSMRRAAPRRAAPRAPGPRSFQFDIPRILPSFLAFAAPRPTHENPPGWPTLAVLAWPLPRSSISRSRLAIARMSAIRSPSNEKKRIVDAPCRTLYVSPVDPLVFRVVDHAARAFKRSAEHAIHAIKESSRSITGDLSRRSLARSLARSLPRKKTFRKANIVACISAERLQLPR